MEREVGNPSCWYVGLNYNVQFVYRSGTNTCTIFANVVPKFFYFLLCFFFPFVIFVIKGCIMAECSWNSLKIFTEFSVIWRPFCQLFSLSQIDSLSLIRTLQAWLRFIF